jgi:Universal stress protein family
MIMAERFNATLSVVHVIEESTAELQRKRGMDRLCGWIPDNLRTRCHIQEVILEGEPAEQILSIAKSGDHDMIVIGPDHKRFFDSTVIGTTTVRVTRHAPCPVLTVVRKHLVQTPCFDDNAIESPFSLKLDGTSCSSGQDLICVSPKNDLSLTGVTPLRTHLEGGNR